MRTDVGEVFLIDCQTDHIAIKQPPCPGRQVGEDVSPALDVS